MKNRSVLKHSLRTGSLSSLECFNTHIRKSVLEIWGIHILGIMPALHVGQKSSILLSSTNHGSVVQSGRTLVSKTKCRRFKSFPGRQICNGGRVVQCNGLQIRKTVSSNLTRCSKLRKYGWAWLKAAVLKTEGSKGSVGSNPTTSANYGRIIWAVLNAHGLPFLTAKWRTPAEWPGRGSDNDSSA